MKTCKGLFLVILLLCVYVIGCDTGQKMVETVVEPPAVVSMPDAKVVSAVRGALGLAADAPLTPEFLKNLRELKLTDGISDLTGLEYAVNLRELVVTGIHPLSDVSPLANLTNLTILSFGNNSVSDISVLANLTNLTRFSISGTQVTDFSVLANFTKLTELELGSSALSDISVLTNLSNLTELKLFNLPGVDFSVISQLPNLTRLEIWSSGLSDISALAKFPNLTHLGVRFNEISDIAPLVANIGLGIGDYVDLRNNPLNAAATNIYIPALQNRGVVVEGYFIDMQNSIPDVLKEPIDTEALVTALTFDNALDLSPGMRYRFRPRGYSEGTDGLGDWQFHEFYWGSVDEGVGQLREGFTMDSPKFAVIFNLTSKPYSYTLDGTPIVEWLRVDDAPDVFDEIVIEVNRKTREEVLLGGPRRNRFTYPLVVYEAVAIENLTHPDRMFEYE